MACYGDLVPSKFIYLLFLLDHCFVLAIIHAPERREGDEPRRNYRLEDFLWSGSGSGEGAEEGGYQASVTIATRTIFRTTTVLTTVFHTPVPRTTCSQECSTIEPETSSEAQPQPSSSYPHPGPTPVVPEGPLSTTTFSTPDQSIPTTTPSYRNVPDQSYWIVTVLRTNASVLSLSPALIEQRLANLYRLAFHRQQERHLKINRFNGTIVEKLRSLRARREVVSVRVHRVSGGQGNGGFLQLVYSVRVAGRTVDALVASQDMSLLSDNEVSAQLGFPVVTKAEPYVKAGQSVQVATTKDTWLLLVAAISATLLTILLIITFLLIFKKSKKGGGASNRWTMFQSEGGGTGAQCTHTGQLKGNDNGSDIDGEKSLSPTHSLLGSAAMAPNSPGTQRKHSHVHKPSSPNSYLSMPSVKAFPRGAPILGPLDQVLEPETGEVGGSGGHSLAGPLSRHSSANGDPGVLGPLVWDLHCQRLQNKEDNQVDEMAPSVGRMRRRFHELLDDAFSLFGSQSTTPIEDSSAQINNGGAHHHPRAKSAVVLPVERVGSEKSCRPKTSELPYNNMSTCKLTRGAWESSLPSSPVPRAAARPLSAGPFHKPSLEPVWLLADSQLSSTDPAVPLIEAIKQELDKFPSH